MNFFYTHVCNSKFVHIIPDWPNLIFKEEQYSFSFSVTDEKNNKSREQNEILLPNYQKNPPFFFGELKYMCILYLHN